MDMDLNNDLGFDCMSPLMKTFNEPLLGNDDNFSLIDWINKDVFLPSATAAVAAVPNGKEIGCLGSESSHDLTSMNVELPDFDFDSESIGSAHELEPINQVPEVTAPTTTPYNMALSPTLVSPSKPVTPASGTSSSSRRKPVLQKRTVEETVVASKRPEPIPRKRKESGVDENHLSKQPKMHQLDLAEHPEAKGAVQSRVNREKRKRELLRLKHVERKFNRLDQILQKILKSEGMFLFLIFELLLVKLHGVSGIVDLK